MKRLLTLLGVVLLATMTVFAQQDEGVSPPPEITVAFDALEARTGAAISFETIAAFQWESRDFPTPALGCPSPGEVYAQVITPGYQFLITYAGTTYDYRVAENGENAVLCDSFPAQPIEPEPQPTAVDPVPGECGAYYEVTEDDVLLEIARACNTTVERLMEINPDIEDPALIYTGQRLRIPSGNNPYNVSIAPDSGPPGTTITMTATGFPTGATVEYGLGRFRSEYDVFGTREIGEDGTLSVQMTLSENIDVGEELVGVVAINGQESISEIFVVTEGEIEPTPVPTEPEEGATFEQTQIFLVARGDAGRTGIEVGCDDSLIPVVVNVEPTVAPLTAALEELFAINTRTYGQSGLYNALYLSDLSVEGIDIENGVATINLSGELNVGGVCDEPRIEQQLRQTALQYSTIDDVSIFVDGQPLQQAVR